MSHVHLKTLPIAVATLLLMSCNAWEHSSITVTYSRGIQSEMAIDMLERVRIENALKSFAATNGYKCRHGFKDAEEITCKGPHNLHLKYEPALNRPELLVTFSWINSGERNHKEFLSNVSKFTDYMKVVAGDGNVRAVNN